MARPPKLLSAIVRASLPSEDRREISDELTVMFSQRAESRGRTAATLWYFRQTLGFVRHAGLRYWTHELLNPGAFVSEVQLAARGIRRRPGRRARA